MKQLLGVAILLAVGLVVSHRWFGRAKLWGRAHFFYVTGEEFLLLGLVLGPSFTEVIDRDTLLGLEPFVGLGLGYIGFVFGMQFRGEHLVQVPGRYYRATFAQNAVGAGIFFAGTFAALGWSLAGQAVLPTALAMTATAIGTSTSYLYLLDRHTQLGRSDVFRFMRFSAGFDDLLGIALFGAAVCLLRGEATGAREIEALGWVLVSFAVGGVSGLFLLLVERMKRSAREELLLLLGIVLFTGGLAIYLKLSPIFTNAIAGCFFCNRCRESPDYHDLLLKVEKPIFLFMLVLAGAMWHVRLEGAVFLLVTYVVVRALGKYAGAGLAAKVLRPGAPVRASFGLGLAAQSEMAVAMMVNLLLLYPDPLAQLAVTAVFLGVIANGVLGSLYFTWSYRRA